MNILVKIILYIFQRITIACNRNDNCKFSFPDFLAIRVEKCVEYEEDTKQMYSSRSTVVRTIKESRALRYPHCGAVQRPCIVNAADSPRLPVPTPTNLLQTVLLRSPVNPCFDGLLITDIIAILDPFTISQRVFEKTLLAGTSSYNVYYSTSSSRLQ